MDVFGDAPALFFKGMFLFQAFERALHSPGGQKASGGDRRSNDQECG